MSAQENQAAAANKKKDRLKRLLQILLAVAGTVILLAVVLKNVDWNNFMQALESIRNEYVLAAFGCFLLSMAFMSMKFYTAYPEGGLWNVFRALMASNAFYIMPAGAVIGTGSIIGLLRHGDNIYRVSSVVIYDNVTKFFSLVTCFWVGTFIPSVTLPLWIHCVAWVLFLLMLALLMGLLFARTQRTLLNLSKRVERFRWGEQLSSLIQDFIVIMDDFKKHPIRLALHLLLGLAAEACLVFPYMILAQSLGIHVALHDWFWINGLIRIAASLPVGIGGLGPREGALTLLLHWLGVASGMTLTLSLLYSVLNILSSITGALFLIGRHPGRVIAESQPRSAP